MSVRPKGRRCRACHGAGTVIDDDGSRYPCICRESCEHDWAMGDPMIIEVCRNCQAERKIGLANYPTIPAFNRWVNEATGEIAELPVGKHPNKEAERGP